MLYNKPKLIAFLFLLIVCAPLSHLQAQDKRSDNKNKFEWITLDPGISIAKYWIGSQDSLLSSQILLVKIDSSSYYFDAVSSKAQSTVNLDIKTYVKNSGAIIGINGNFFDQSDKALGLIISNSKLIQGVHKRGNVLTGVFSTTQNDIFIDQRENFNNYQSTFAIQAGPRLIENGNIISSASSDSVSRRSGVAITRNKEVILYATMLRFPGASLREIQNMLIEPELNIVQALNLDGGGSSQLFIDKIGGLQEEIFISGGDSIPVGIVVKRKK